MLGFKEQVLVDSKDPDAKPLPVSKMMVHHLLYYTPGRVDEGSAAASAARSSAGAGRSTRTGSSRALSPPEHPRPLRRPQRHARRHGAGVVGSPRW